MLSKLVRYFLLTLVLLLVFLASMLTAMRFAVHGREVRVPKLAGLTPAEAERTANANGLMLSVESRFYAAEMPEGRIVSQSPVPDTLVRRGWKVLVAESLGPQRAAIPNLIGQSEHAADINISRRGLSVGTTATVHFPGATPATVIAQNPAPNAGMVNSPKVDLLLSAADNTQRYVMPNFVGRSLAEAQDELEKAGFAPAKILNIAAPSGDSSGLSVISGIIIGQRPLAGQKITTASTISFDVQR